MTLLSTLKARLLAWLIVPLLFLSTAHVATTYIDTRATSEQIFDKLLVTLALSINEYALASGGDLLTDDVLELIRTTTNENLYYKVIGPDSAFLMGYDDIPEPRGGLEVLDGHIQFYDAVYFDQQVRVLALSSLVDRPDYAGWMTTYVAQTINDRGELVWSTVVNSIARVMALAVTTVGLLAVGIILGLKPLSKLQEVLRKRRPEDLSPIGLDTTHTAYPKEITLLVNALNELLQRLANHVSLTKRFVENAAHELRTPVAALLPQSELAFRNAETERERRAVGRIKQSAEKIARLTHQLLNLTYAESVKLDAGDFPILNLAELVDEHLESYQRTAPELTIIKNLECATVVGSPGSISEVLDNLLDNARCHGQAECIEISTGVDGGNAFLDILDHGAGLDPSELDRVTERFYRVNKTQPGSGLGLSIVKEIVEAHDGVCKLSQGPDGKGLRVRCTFPPVKPSGAPR